MAISPTTRRRAFLPRRRLVGLALLLLVSCRGGAQTGAGSAGGEGGSAAAAPPPAADATVDSVRVFLIAPGDAGKSGAQVACHDSIVPVTLPLSRPATAIGAALDALLALREPTDRASGLANPLYSARLRVAAIDRPAGGAVLVHLTGYVERGEPCDNQRMLAQLTATARQFAGVASARFDVEGAPLADLLLGAAPAAGASPSPSPEPPVPAGGTSPSPSPEPQVPTGSASPSPPQP